MTSTDTAPKPGALPPDVADAIRSGDMPAAMELAERALQAGARHPVLLNLRALRRENAGRLEEALADLQQAQALAPQDFTIANATGLCLLKLDQTREAVAAFDKALQLRPDFPPAHHNRGWALEMLGELSEARTSHERALALNPNFAEALARLSSLAVRRSDHDEARRLAERALAIEPGQRLALLSLAEAELGGGEPAAAEARLKALLHLPDLDLLTRAIASSRIGDALDKQGRAAEAFAAYTAGNTALKELYGSRYSGPSVQTVPQMLRWLTAYFEGASPDEWRAPARPGRDAQGSRTHVFLVGFPRSGTTLLEQVLAAAPDVVSLEEKPTFSDALRDLMGDKHALDRLASLDDAGLAPYRRAYWRRVREFGVEPADRVFIDKLPLNTIKLPLIAKLFPDAKILFALRDPRDVVLSGFRRMFTPNPSMYELLTLDGAARLYDGVMGLAEIFRGKLELDLHEVRYESLVREFETEARAACDFLGMPWNEAMRDFAGRARSGAVATPSATQVARGLYREGEGQWRRYAEQMAPVMPILQPWVRRYGYAES